MRSARRRRRPRRAARPRRCRDGPRARSRASTRRRQCPDSRSAASESGDDRRRARAQPAAQRYLASGPRSAFSSTPAGLRSKAATTRCRAVARHVELAAQPNLFRLGLTSSSRDSPSAAAKAVEPGPELPERPARGTLTTGAYPSTVASIARAVAHRAQRPRDLLERCHIGGSFEAVPGQHADTRSAPSGPYFSSPATDAGPRGRLTEHALSCPEAGGGGGREGSLGRHRANRRPREGPRSAIANRLPPAGPGCRPDRAGGPRPGSLTALR